MVRNIFLLLCLCVVVCLVRIHNANQTHAHYPILRAQTRYQVLSHFSCVCEKYAMRIELHRMRLWCAHISLAGALFLSLYLTVSQCHSRTHRDVEQFLYLCLCVCDLSCVFWFLMHLTTKFSTQNPHDTSVFGSARQPPHTSHLRKDIASLFEFCASAVCWLYSVHFNPKDRATQNIFNSFAISMQPSNHLS